MTTLDEPTLRLVRSITRWYARRAVHSPAIDADDLFQEGCLAILKAAGDRGGGISRELAATIARRACTNAWRRTLGGDAGAAAAAVAAAESPRAGAAVASEESLDLAEALASIRPEDAEVLRLRFLESATYDEIADRLAIARHVAVYRSARGLAELRDRLGADYAERWARAVPLRRPDEYKAWARRLGRPRPAERSRYKGPPSECARIAAARLAILDRARNLASHP